MRDIAKKIIMNQRTAEIFVLIFIGAGPIPVLVHLSLSIEKTTDFIRNLELNNEHEKL